MNLSTIGLASLALGCTLSAQVNLVTNGDFETGSLAPWVESGYTLSSQVSQHDCSGAGSSFTFNCLHGGKSGQTRQPNGYWPGNAIEQPVLFVQTVEYLFTADVQVQNIQSPTTSNADAGMVEVFVDGTAVGSFDFKGYAANSDVRNRMCFTFTATTTGVKPLKIEFSRKYYSSARTPTMFIDNVTVVQSPVRPLVCPRGEREVGATANIDIDGTPSSKFALFLGTSKLTTGISIGGFNGAWWLSGVTTQLFTAQFDANGNYSWKPAVPTTPGLAGLLLHWQAIEANTAVNLGEATSFAFYQ